MSSGSESGSDNEGRNDEGRPRGLFGSDEEDDDDRRGYISEAEEDNRGSGGRGGGDKNTDDEEEEERKKQEREKKEAEKKKKPKGPVRRQMISEDMLTGKNGLSKIPELFEDFKFGGKGREKEDLSKILAKLEHWIHLLHPKQPFDQSLQRIEFLGLKRKVIKTHMKKIRMGLVNFFDDVPLVDDDDNDMVQDINTDELESAITESERREVEKESTQSGPSNENASTSSVNKGTLAAISNDEFPDDDDEFFEVMNGDKSGGGKENADPVQSGINNDIDEEMDVDMEDDFPDDDDFFQKELDARLKQAAAAEAKENANSVGNGKEVEVNNTTTTGATSDSAPDPIYIPNKTLTDVNEGMEEETIIVRSGEMASGIKSPTQNHSIIDADATTKLIGDGELDSMLLSGINPPSTDILKSINESKTRLSNNDNNDKDNEEKQLPSSAINTEEVVLTHEGIDLDDL